MRKALRTVFALCLVVGLAVFFMSAIGAQTPQAPQQAAASAAPQAPAAPTPVNQSDDPLLKSFRWRNIGPATMGGRIDDFAVVESNPSIYYVGFATGGVFKTVNNGTTFTPIFDTYPTSSIGDIAVAPSDPNIVYVGTGEPNNRQSSSFGDGIYKSTDAGKTFTNVGLKDTQSIARIVIHPTKPDIVYVAAIGHLFGPNKERGLYKTIDGGKTWTNTKFIDEDTGLHRRGDGSEEPRGPVRGVLPAAPHAARLQRRRPGQRTVEDDRRRQDVDEADGQRPARQPDHRPHRPRHLPDQAERHRGADRSRRQRRHGRRRDGRRQGAGARAGARRSRRGGR